MREVTQDAVDEWWREVFGVGDDELWSTVTVQHPHGRLGSYEGWYVAWREAGVHISAPPTAEADDVTRLRDEPAPSLQNPEFWKAFGQQRGLVIGPVCHPARSQAALSVRRASSA